MVTCTLIAWAALALPPGAVTTQPKPALAAVLAAVPAEAGAHIRVEGGLLFANLRENITWAAARRAQQSQTPAGAAYYASAGLGLWGQVQELVALAAPGGQPVPAGVVAFAREDTMGVQLFMKVQPGFMERAAAAKLPQWSAEMNGQRLTVSAGDLPLVGRMDEQGWFRLSTDENMLVGASPESPPLLSESLRGRLPTYHSMAFIHGGGLASEVIAAAVGIPELAGILQSMRGLVVGIHTDGDKTVAADLLVDSSILGEVAGMLRPMTTRDDLLGVWDQDAQSFLSLALPREFIGPLIGLGQGLLQSDGLSLTEPLGRLLEQMDGRLGFAEFGSPSDWAFGVQMQDAQSAAQLVPELFRFATQLAQGQGLALRSLQLESPAEGPPVLVHRPDPGLEGLRITSVGTNVVVVNQRARLESVLSGGTGVGTHLTPMMKHAIEQPHLMLGYMVLGEGGILFDILGAALGFVHDGWTLFIQERSELAWLTPWVQSIPTQLVLEGFSWSLLYDLAVVVNLNHDVLTVQLLSSEI